MRGGNHGNRGKWDPGGTRFITIMWGRQEQGVPPFSLPMVFNLGVVMAENRNRKKAPQSGKKAGAQGGKMPQNGGKNSQNGGGKAAGGNRSSLSAATNQRRNTQTGRDRMSESNFAVPKGKGSKPEKDQYRVDDQAHARNALARVSQFGSPEEKRMVRRKVAQKYPSIASGGTSSGGKAAAGGSPGRKRRS